MHFSSDLAAQSVAYKALLSTLYDSDFPIVKPAELTDLSKYQIVDTREKEEFEVSHLKGANWVGYDTFSIDNVSGLDKNQPVLVYCTVGARSQEIGKKLKEAGFNQVYNLYGGLIEWANEKKPIFHEGSQTNKVHTYSKSWGIWLTKGEKVY
ncbi:rhodanese-related sulfurtransferase [Algoriphagus chordae]|uniref:Rhodanese-related sulfurtransferase n=1 Tax=Algoriphagus chordae TaxID=237019 RepID=A0A2W7RJE4_9BACT|nr:rhodanese-related sulfurtransferase [Algoriphagus chordae]